MAIKFILLQNRQGKTRVSKWYIPVKFDEKAEVEREVHRIVTTRPSSYTNFIEFRTYKLVYRRYAGLYFTMGVDEDENGLACLEAIHLFVETLDAYFKNVVELDIVFNFHKVYAIVDEIFTGGEIIETSKREMIASIAEVDRLEKSSA